MSEENRTGSSLIWAVALIIITAIIAGTLFYSGVLSGNKKTEVEVNVNVPTSSNK